MRDIKPLLLLLLSLGLVATWVYHLYDKTNYTSRRTEVFVKDSVAIADAVRDSLSRSFRSTISSLDTRLDSTRFSADSMRGDLDVKIKEINRLKSEINIILGRRSVTDADLQSARGKIAELQLLVEQLRTRNTSMESEKAQLNGILSQLGQTADSLQRNIRKLTDDNAVLSEKVAAASIFIASEISITAMQLRADRETPTTQAKRADKFVAAFTIQNNLADFPNAEIAIIVLRPDKQVVQNEDWNSGSIETRQGRRAYSRMIRFDYEKSERKQMTFSLTLDDFQKGKYIMELWHRGARIGLAECVLQ